MNGFKSLILAGIFCSLIASCDLISSEEEISGSPEGKWKTDYGEMTIQVKNDSGLASYKTQNGDLYGVINGLNYEGLWVEPSANVKCDTPLKGSDYWGTFKFKFDSKHKAFKGFWQYCDREPINKVWNGTRISE